MKKILAAVLASLMVVSLVLLTSCGKTETEKKTLKVAMECAYAPYNWAQSDNSNNSVPISGRSDFANGYDVMIAKKICEKNGWDLEIYSLEWDALIPAVQTGQVDCVIAGQSVLTLPQRQSTILPVRNAPLSSELSGMIRVFPR